MTNAHEHELIRSTVEALILASPEPLPVSRIVQVAQELSPARVSTIIAELNERYQASGTSFRIRLIAGGYQFYILSEYVGYVEELFARRRKMRLTRAALETVAIVAYKQPITKAEIEQIRGVASDGVLQTLLEKQMVTIVGRAATAGKPLQYGTDNEFLKFFGLASLGDLPRMNEIEELIAARELAAQTELKLPAVSESHDMQEKLNIADGTFDPASRMYDGDSGADDGRSVSIASRELSEERTRLERFPDDREPAAEPLSDEYSTEPS